MLNTKIIKTITLSLLLIIQSLLCNVSLANFNYKEYKDKPDILIISGHHYKKIVDSLVAYLPAQRFNVSIKYIKKQELISKIDHDIDFIITIGRESTLRANEYLSTTTNAAPLLAVLIPRKMYNSIVNNLQDNKDQNRKITAIYREQPVERQLKVIEKLLPEVKTIGVLTSMYDPSMIEQLKSAVLKKHINLVITENDKRENLIDSLKHVLSNSDLLLTLPDPEIYNPFTAKGILVTSFRRGIPIIGYSKTYVDAGAVAAVYTKAGQIAQQAASVTNTYFLKNSLPPPNYPAQYAIAKNEKMLEVLRDIKANNQKKNHKT
jgi:putative ABC transport system substrate-binding protein